jgi:hypothetical protein
MSLFRQLRRVLSPSFSKPQFTLMSKSASDGFERAALQVICTHLLHRQFCICRPQGRNSYHIHTVASKNFLLHRQNYLYNYVRCNLHGPKPLSVAGHCSDNAWYPGGEDGPVSMSTDGAGYKLNLTNPLPLGTERIVDTMTGYGEQSLC